MIGRGLARPVTAQAICLGWAAWLVFILEWLSRSSLVDALTWAGRHFVLFAFSLLLTDCLLLLVQGLTGSARVSFWIVAAVTLPPAFVSGIVLRALGRPLLLGDLLVIKEAEGVAGWQDYMGFSAVAGLAVFLAGSLLLVHRPTVPPVSGWRRRTAQAAACGLLLLAAVLLPIRALASSAWDPVATVRADGFVVTQLLDLRERTARRNVTAAAPAIAPADPATAQPEPEKVRPNIILILSESFWDPTLLPDAHFDSDPIPFFHELQRSYPHGWLLSPEFGGSTANVELEVLTGLSRQFFPQGSIAYMQYIKKPTDSLASILTRQGYSAIAITPWQHWFFKSDQVYQRFGFGKFISQEFYPPLVSGDYIADADTARMILDESARQTGPYFIFANTSENHAAYYVGKFPKNTVAVSGVPENAAGILETYAEGCKRADEMLRTLVTHFAGRPEPTMIVWFGDHLPGLGAEYLSYRAAHYITGESDPDFYEKTHRVPALIWSNYKPAQPDTFAFGTNLFGPYILKEAGLPGTAFTEYLQDLGTRVPAVPPRRYWADLHLPEADLQGYEALQNDIVYGDQTTYGSLKERIANPGYIIGHGPIVIEQVEPDAPGASGGLVPVVIRGRNLPRTGVVYANGQPLPTTWENYETIHAKLPTGTAPIEIRVLDDERSVVARSEAFSVTIP